MAKFTVVTACRNAARYIEETVRSVLAQSVFRSGKAELEYLVCDGASTDATLELLRPFEREGVRVTSEPDSGFYAALAKGLQRATGDYVAYLNAGDLLHPAGLAIAAECFELPGVNWLTGYAAIYNEQSQLVRCWLPFRYRRPLFECAAYGTLLPFVQQESTVWRRSLQATVDFGALEKLRYAGDAYLWKCFATAAELFVVRGLIGGFRIHRGQISERLGEYRQELRSFSRASTPAERAQCLVERALWHLPERLKLMANQATLIHYDHERQAWRRGKPGVA
jgi:glycosyltransferase involved in cell wall biosynthesis